jgi:hypothetical protein
MVPLDATDKSTNSVSSPIIGGGGGLYSSVQENGLAAGKAE